MKTTINIRIEANQLSEQVKNQMWEVYQNYYHYSYKEFIGKMAKSTHYAFYYADNKLVGFTGLRINRVNIDGKKRLLMYFGQTVVERAYRGINLIQITGMKLILKYFSDVIRGNAYYWCDALTYRAYLVFAKSIRDFYPSHRHATPTATRQLMDRMGEMHYGESYQAASGTISKTVKYVNDHTVEASASDLEDDDINFYVNANPAYVSGNGLLVMAPINFRNTWHLINRFFKKRRQIRTSSIPHTYGQLITQS